MDAVEFYRTFKRMCYKTDCKDCLLEQKCRPSANVEPEEVVELVEQWAKDNPVKTRQSEFLKLFPNAPKSGRVLNICPQNLNIDYMPPKRCENISCSVCKTDYWNEEVTDND